MTRKIRVLHILWSGVIGGAEEYVKNLLEHMDSGKFDVTLCVLAKKGEISDEIVKRGRTAVFFMEMKNGFDVAGAMRFLYFLLTNRFDIVHSNTRNIISTAIVCLISRASKVITHHLSPGDRDLVRKSKPFYRVFGRFFRRIIAISDAVKINLVQEIGISDPERIEIVYNGIDPVRFDPSVEITDILPGIRQNGEFVLGFVGRMVPYKRPSLFVDVAAELLRMDINSHFVMTGDGPELKTCSSLIKEYGIEKHFSMLGSRRDVPNVIRQFDALLFTSAAEGFGIVIIEAMAMGVPVFAVREGAVSEIIRHRESGIILEGKGPGEIARDIASVVKEPELLARIRKESLKIVRERFTIDACARHIGGIYTEILSGA